MTSREREEAYLRRWRKKAMSGDPTAFHNTAASYRILGKPQLAFRWWNKISRKDGNNLVELGYCYHHGAGVRRNLTAAERLYRAAIRSQWITDFGREEALYLLAVLSLKKTGRVVLTEIKRLLRRANLDGDYPQAQDLLEALRPYGSDKVCTCRRFLRRGLAITYCPIHRKK